MRIESAGSSHVGMKRANNEDNYVLLPDFNLFVVADGMGGHASGEIASKLAIDEISDFFRLTAADVEVTWPFKMDKARNYAENRLSTGIKVANKGLYEANHPQDGEDKDMGTTMVAVYFEKEHAYVAHVGDSRVYLWQPAQSKFSQVTEDHSLLNDYIRSGKLKPEEIAAFPYKNVILRALGQKDSVLVDVSHFTPAVGDTFLLCSDGLSGMVTDPQMQSILERTENLEKCSHQMVDAANAAGGTDNVTCVLVRVAEL
jgi:protein phosphatase